jgi:hypothetical protein
MKRKRVIYTAAGVTALVVVAGVAALVLRYEPLFYREGLCPPGPERKKHSLEFVNSALQLTADSRDKSRWASRFNTEQVNSYFAENLVSDGEGKMKELLPEGISDPRVSFGDGKVRLAFRYGTRPWCTVVSVDIRVWLVPNERNVVALEIESVRAGLLPISVQTMLERLAETIRQHNRSMEFTWYRYNGHRVALLRLQADRVVPTIRLDQVDLHDGVLTIQGSAL